MYLSYSQFLLFVPYPLALEVINFRRARAEPQVLEWLSTFQPFRMMGCVVSKQSQQNWSKPKHFPHIRLDKTFDGMTFVQRTTRAKPNLPVRTGDTPC